MYPLQYCSLQRRLSNHHDVILVINGKIRHLRLQVASPDLGRYYILLLLVPLVAVVAFHFLLLRQSVP